MITGWERTKSIESIYFYRFGNFDKSLTRFLEAPICNSVKLQQRKATGFAD